MARDRGPWVRVTLEDFPIHLIHFDQEGNALDDFYLRKPAADAVTYPVGRLRVIPPPAAASWRLDTETGRTVVRHAPPDPLPRARGRQNLIFVLAAATIPLYILDITGLVRFPFAVVVAAGPVSLFTVWLNLRTSREERAYWRWFGLR